MTDQIDVTLTHPHGGDDVGTKLTLDRGDAKRLIRAGVAIPTNAAAAKAVDLPASAAATGKK